MPNYWNRATNMSLFPILRYTYVRMYVCRVEYSAIARFRLKAIHYTAINLKAIQGTELLQLSQRSRILDRTVNRCVCEPRYPTLVLLVLIIHL